jgi:hypothetical protein
VSERVRQREQRPQAPVQGFRKLVNPPVYGVNRAFKDVMKTSSVKNAALMRVLAKYALLDEHGEPIEAVAKLFAQSNFGYGDDPTKGMRTGDPTFGTSMGMPMETGDRNGLSAQLSYGGV